MMLRPAVDDARRSGRRHVSAKATKPTLLMTNRMPKACRSGRSGARPWRRTASSSPGGASGAPKALAVHLTGQTRREKPPGRRDQAGRRNGHRDHAGRDAGDDRPRKASPGQHRIVASPIRADTIPVKIPPPAPATEPDHHGRATRRGSAPGIRAAVGRPGVPCVRCVRPRCQGGVEAIPQTLRGHRGRGLRPRSIVRSQLGIGIDGTKHPLGSTTQR